MNWINRIKYRVAFFLIVLLGMMGVSTQLNDFEIAKNLEIFSNIYRELNTYYADEIDPEYLMETGANAMLHSLDPYTTFIPADEVAAFNSSISGQYGGIGTAVFSGKEYVTISLPYENSPAQKAGLKVGDQIVTIDGKDMKNKPMGEVSNAMRGIPNTPVNIQVKRYGTPQLIDISLEREIIQVNNTPYVGVLDNNIGYINLSTFSSNAGNNVANALQQLNKNNQLEGVVLDLRGNTGGLLTEAVNVVNVFVKKGSVVVKIKGRDKARDRVFRTLNPSVDTQIPLVVLIDKSSASASEIVAGAIQDLDRGVIIGQRSFGKGLVQNTRDLPSGAKIKLTTARYYIPSDRSIQALEYDNGKPRQIADSLKVAYKTKGGRKVYDGGGIAPDITISKKAYYPILSSLLEDNHLFEYAIRYNNDNRAVASLEQFEITDQTFEDFIQFVQKRGFNYETNTEKVLTKLKEKVEKEEYNTILAPQLKAIKTVVNRTGEQELRNQKQFLMTDLQRQIAATYYARKGAIIAGLKNDVETAKALEVLHNLNQYKNILGK